MKWSQKKELIVGGLSWHLNGFKFINKPFTKFAFYFFFKISRRKVLILLMSSENMIWNRFPLLINSLSSRFIIFERETFFQYKMFYCFICQLAAYYFYTQNLYSINWLTFPALIEISFWIKKSFFTNRVFYYCLVKWKTRKTGTYFSFPSCYRK